MVTSKHITTLPKTATRHTLTRREYSCLLDLYHEVNDAYIMLPAEMRRLFMDYLYERKQFND